MLWRVVGGGKWREAKDEDASEDQVQAKKHLSYNRPKEVKATENVITVFRAAEDQAQ